MILSDKKILDEIKKKTIVITPFDVKNMGGNSYDVHLSENFATYTNKTLDAKKHYPQVGHVGRIEIAHSLEEALEKTNTDEEVFVIGGAEIYKQAINIANKLYITHIENEDKEADSFFPIIDKEIWQEKKREDFKTDTQNYFDYSFVEYERK